MFFGNKKISQKNNSPVSDESEHPKHPESEDKTFYDRPRICAIDLSDEHVNALKSHRYDCYSGTLGHIVEVPNARRNDAHLCLPNLVFPENIHEYDIVIIDLQNRTTVQYRKENHSKKYIKGRSDISLVSSYPETLFDPRALSAKILSHSLSSFMEKDSILIVFADEQEEITYYSVAITSMGTEHLGAEKHWLYDFYSDMPINHNLSGKDTEVVIDQRQLFFPGNDN